MKKINFIFLIPILWFLIGLVYARSLESFASIGVMILTLVSSFGILIGTIIFRVTKKPIISVISTILLSVLIYILIIILSRLSY